MSNILDRRSEDALNNTNITTRRLTDVNKIKMALREDPARLSEEATSLLVDSILSKDEELDVLSMLDMAKELDGLNALTGFFTSTQMGKREPKTELSSPPLSPVPFPVDKEHYEPRDSLSSYYSRQSGKDFANQVNLIEGNQHDLLTERGKGNLMGKAPGSNTRSQGRAEDVMNVDPARPDDLGRPEVTDLIDNVGVGPLTPALQDVKTITSTPNFPGPHDVKTITTTPTAVDLSVGADDGDEEESDDSIDVTSEADSKEGKGEGDDSDTSMPHKGENKAAKYMDHATAATRLAQIDDLLLHLNTDSATLASTVKNLESSLEFSYKEIADLKKENTSLKLKLGNVETEDKRTQFQLKDVADKLDRLDSVSKKKNLVFDGIPEMDGRKEDTDKVIGALFDQLQVGKEIAFEACYRLGPYSKSKPRSILVSFDKQSDRDLVYSRRMNLKRTADYSRVWINEDISPASRRKREIIRLITREAHDQGIDCRSGKYAMHINNVKFDENNLDDLPPPLHPTSLKQVVIDKATLAYQSEYAPLSNFYACQIIIGKHRFFCAEQAFQFLKAKTLSKPLAATRIYLSRDVRFIKQEGRDLGTSDEWEARKYDYMYLCLKKKFDQNPTLKAMLLSTGDLELVEATPDRLWGCGATLSSNALRRHDWPGMNKHGAILMTIRDEFRQTSLKKV